MKRLLTIASFLFFAISAVASHIVGGVIHYECLGNGEYAVTLKVYRDCSGSAFDNTAHVGIYEGSTFIASIDMPLSDAIVTALPADTGDPCLEPPDVCVEESIYTGTIILDESSIGYTLVYQRCCRNTSIINVPAGGDNLGSSFIAEIPPIELAVCNSNPDFIEFPPIVICLNEQFVFDHSAIDIDGDSLVYEFCNPLDGGNPGQEMDPPTAPPYVLVAWNAGYSLDYPIDAFPEFAINSETGLLTGTPSQLGQYVMGICVKEYRDGLLISNTNRDFQFNIAACTQNISASIEDEEPCQGLTYTFENNSNGEFFFWDFGVELLESDTSIAFEPEYTFPDTGNYLVTLIVNPGFSCADTTTILVGAYTPIETAMQIQDFYCENGSRFWDFTGFGNYSNGAEFSWDFGAVANPNSSTEFDPGIVSYNVAGNYEVIFTVTDHGCEASTSQFILVDPMPQADIQSQSVFCEGLEIDFANLSQFSELYLWNFGEDGNTDFSVEENPTWTYSEYGDYLVTLTADPLTECFDIDTILVSILPTDPIIFNFYVNSPSPCDSVLEVSLDFSGTGADNVIWDMGDGTVLSGSSTAYIYDIPGDYTINITAQNNLCNYSETEQVIIVYDLTIIDRPISMPNVFSPNFDGVNDIFRIFYAGEYNIPDLYPTSRDIFDYVDDYELKIYDRWGVLLFSSDENYIGWDGTANGNPMPEGTYYYIAQWRRICLDSFTTKKSGHFSILR
jgi:gliding motility-associated-like protein